MTPDETNRHKQKSDAKILYLEGKPFTKICELTGVPLNTLKRWIYVGASDERPWKELLQEHTNEIVDEIYLRTKTNTARIFEVGIPLIYNSIVYRAKKKGPDGAPQPLSIKEARELTEILTAFDKLRRLDANQPTSIEETRQHFVPVTIDELRAAVIKDEFIDLIPLKKGVDYVERLKETDVEVKDETTTDPFLEDK